MPVAVVTGSSSGIGQASALELARAGYDLLLHTRRNLSGLQDTVRACKALEPVSSSSRKIQIRCVSTDISCSYSCRDLVQAAFHWQGRVDAWLNIAGADVLTGALARQSFDEQLERLLHVDVLGTIRISRDVADRMQQQDVTATTATTPIIVNIGWDQALTGMEGKAGQMFCTTKAAVEAFTRALALSTGPHVRVHLVCPGWIRTKWGETAPEYWDQRAKGESLLGRWGTAEDVAKTIAWLCSEQAAFVNSQVIAVNGGLRNRPIDKRNSG